MCARVFRILYRTIENPEQKETKKKLREKKRRKKKTQDTNKFYENSAEQQIATPEYCHGEKAK